MNSTLSRMAALYSFIMHVRSIKVAVIRNKQVTALQCMFVQEILIIILGQLNLTAMGRWPLYTGDRRDRFHCSWTWCSPGSHL